MIRWVLVVASYTLALHGVSAQQQKLTDEKLYSSDCPAPNGFFADAYQCDKYYACTDNFLEEKLCADGLVFNDFNPTVEKCDFPFQVKCDDRPERQKPQISKNCPRKNGYFAHEDESVCDRFFYCSDGTDSEIVCPVGLVFSLKTGTCVWPANAGRTNCMAEKVVNFTCPKESIDIASAHPRYSDPDDCQYFYVCINGEDPRHNGCPFGKIFNPEIQACDAPKNFPNCSDYYTDYFEDYFKTLSTSGQIATPEIIAAAIGSGFAIPDAPRRVKLDPNAPPRRRKPQDPDRTAIPPRRRRPTDGESPLPTRRRRPLRTRKRKPTTTTTTTTTSTTTTTTTTTPPIPKAVDPHYEYYDYYDYYTDEPAPVAPGALGKGQSSRGSA